MSGADIRATFLEFFTDRGHVRLPSGSLVPAEFDPSVLLTTAGMHPLKPYFLGREQPPARRLTSCQKCFRTPDIEHVGSTARHLTFFEMLGNFSIGDYFKAEAIGFAWTLSLEGFGFDPERIWVTVFAGDEALGLGADEQAIELWQSQGVPAERIVRLPRSENFWQAGPTGPCGPCSELYLDRGIELGAPDDLPGGDNDRFLEYWNLVFMQYDQSPPETLTPLPASNIDTGLGLERMAAIQQGVPSVFETDLFRPLIELGEELSGRRYGEAQRIDRALRILADHSRAMTFLVADGVVPSNEHRGYVLRRIMRRAIQQGRALELPAGFLVRYGERVSELMAGAYPELHTEQASIRQWLASEEESFGHTLEQGTRLLGELVERARQNGDEGIAAEDAFRLHDTYGFPIDLTLELVAEAGLGVDEEGFDALMEDQRTRARAQATTGPLGADLAEREQLSAWAREAAPPTVFTGYETIEQATTVAALARQDGRALVKLAESPFYAAGGGQVSDSGELRCEGGDCQARVAEVIRIGDDQAIAVVVEQGELQPGERVVARVDPALRRATACNHTATHLLHAALRQRLGRHVRQAGSAVQPDKLRFDFTHGGALAAEDLRAVEDQVNEWIVANHPVRALTTTLAEARRLGATALFGEKYGDIVRMVEVGDGSFSRELCGGTHVHATAEIGLFRILAETSSAANVRRIEALTGPAAIALLRRHDDLLRAAAQRLRTTPDRVLDALDAHERRLHELEQAARRGERANGALDVAALAARAQEVGGARVLTEAVAVGDPQALLELTDRLKGQLGDAVIVLGAVGEGRVHLVASVAPALVQRGLQAGQIVRRAAEVTGGGGGGRDTLARAGGRDPDKLPEALAAARAAIDAALAS